MATIRSITSWLSRMWRPVCPLEYTSVPSTVTSKTPPELATSSTWAWNSFLSASARLAAIGS